ncbi:MAG: 16S rRNA (cytosine(1402)-N(4))-methyltransferase RsmH [Clostridiales bacterium]|jgi:16S rRNA (cytosine1402-N4)-methyltransferase|nr:16S rRNA (cytosine(1402)-N(4))-methyltransferase RsmH [Clostridiales bacterium]
MTGREFSHIPVLLQEVIDGLNVKQDGLYVDGTLGGAGHAARIAERGARLIGIDRDAAAIDAAAKRLPNGVTLVRGNYNDITAILQSLNIEKIDGALLDLGVSSYQLDTPGRGFSYRFDAPLDMRMDRQASLTAERVVNDYSVEELERLLFAYGEEPHARAIAGKIGERRADKTITSTFELVEIIKSALPPKVLRKGKHPAKRTFQAIRIAVNDELSRLNAAINGFCGVMVPGGRLAVITFHSLEDRIVKTAFTELARGCVCPTGFPVCVCGNTPKARIITKKPVLPSGEELARNPRSASAKLRILEKL